jgi:predicted RNA-binding Zn-ribbon protein involved in translation (DUF1610 family)
VTDDTTPAAAPPPIPDRAMRHQTEDTSTYPCASCGAQLVFDPSTQKLKCPSCGNTQDVVTDAERVTAEQDFAQAVAALKASADTGPVLEGEKEVVCQSCGGHTTFTGTLTSTRCPYCATPIQRDDVHDAPARLAVDGVLPFKVDEKNAKQVVEKWINGRRFAPSEFKKYKQTGSFASVYAAYFTYDADAETDYTGRRGEEYTVTVGSGENKRTETRVRWYPAAGTVRNEFDDVCVLANDGFQRDKVVKLEPWPTSDAVPFSKEYVAGHLCRTYDNDVEACFPEAAGRMESEIESTIRRDIGGDRQEIFHKATAYRSLTFKHLLLPIWLLTVIYAGKPFQVFINGVTGEVQGQRPWSKVKIAVAIVLALIVIIAIAAIVMANQGEPAPQ